MLSLCDWPKVAAKVGKDAIGCYSVTGRVLRGRRTASDAAVRSRLAVQLLEGLQAHSIDLRCALSLDSLRLTAQSIRLPWVGSCATAWNLSPNLI